MSSASRARSSPDRRFFSSRFFPSDGESKAREKIKGTTDYLSVAQTNRRAYRTFLFCLLCLASFLSLLIAQLVLGKRLDQEGKCLELMSFFRILNTPREFFVGSRQKLINMLRSVQNIHVETAYGGLSQVHWPSRSSSPWSLAVRRTCSISSPSTAEDARARDARGPIADLDSHLRHEARAESRGI